MVTNRQKQLDAQARRPYEPPLVVDCGKIVDRTLGTMNNTMADSSSAMGTASG